MEASSTPGRQLGGVVRFGEFDDPVTDVEFDPGNWILKYVSEVSAPATGVEDVPTALALSAARRTGGGDRAAGGGGAAQ